MPSLAGDGGAHADDPDTGASDAGDDAMVAPPLKACAPSLTSEALPQREAVMASDPSALQSTNSGVYTSQLFDEFKRHCGDCHAGSAGHGGLSVNFGTFSEKIGENALARIRAEQDFMPPAPQGKPFSERGEDDPLRAFAARLEQWIADGSPSDVFYPDDGAVTSGTSASPYLLDKRVGMQMTNLANCIPEPAEMTDADRTRAEALDDRFAAVERFQDLPKSLRDTDLTTLDAAQLAKQRVFAFAPAYTLWADNAKKIRFIRVPVGESVRFDPDTQSFDIPDNTRFYKTFLKRTVDLDGNERYRKMETRIIVARPAKLESDGSPTPQGIFGTYKWNEAESEATLVDTPYRDGEGFVDTLEPYIVDERLDDEILRSGPADQLAARLEAGSMRNYAIPGFDRCMHCHMGQRSFVLGFTPLQVMRRALGEGGVIEPAERDELNQLQRLIDYGVITGMGSPADVVPLEASQGDRKPRNDHELRAQGYMLGNCAHCHNPEGFPSRKEESLKTALDFMPSEDGGIFQFPLEKFSPRTFRGVAQDIPTPYITPSLFDHYYERLGLASFEQAAQTFSLRWVVDATADEARRVQNRPGLPGDLRIGRPIFAPWRSLIYRNVDTPFSYEETGTIYPHMPIDTPGYDCRARRLLGSWMVSIPARWKREGFEQPAIIGSGPTVYELDSGYANYKDQIFNDPEPQPFEEVSPDDPEYPRLERLARTRLRQFEEGERYNDCPDPELDVLDPITVSSGTVLPAAQHTLLLDEAGATLEEYHIASPGRPHYFETDLRSSSSWIIRRGDWHAILVEGEEDPYVRGASGKKRWQLLRDILQTIALDDVRDIALAPRPFGLWVDKPECDGAFDDAGVPRASSFAGTARPEWMALAPELDESSPVYMSSAGAQVFSMICSKCHGPAADGQSSLASTIADLSGGLTRVANLRDGLFGPIADPGSNRGAIDVGFGRTQDAVEGVSVDDWAARYVVWMGLGGTRANIPQTAVASVGRSEILGQRSGITLSAAARSADAANMLEIAVRACEEVLPRPRPPSVFPGAQQFDPKRGQLVRRSELELPPSSSAFYAGLEDAGLIVENGHAELWQTLCGIANPKPVRIIAFDAGLKVFYVTALYERAAYPAAPIGDHTGATQASLDAANEAPFCIARPALLEELAMLDARLAAEGLSLPMCPDALLAPEAPGAIADIEHNYDGDNDIKRWALRGAMNAGMSVFLYLDALARGEIAKQPAYDRCEDLR